MLLLIALYPFLTWESEYGCILIFNTSEYIKHSQTLLLIGVMANSDKEGK